MNVSEILQQAQDIIGAPHKGDKDWIIAPTDHSNKYEETAPELAKILSSSRIQGTAKQFEGCDQEAIAAQEQFKETARRANWAVLLTSCCGAFVFVVNVLDFPDNLEEIFFLALGVGAVIIGALGTMYVNRIQAGKMLEAWMSRRAKAETHRLSLFELVTGFHDHLQTDSDIPLPLIQLEYFRRYQMDVQIAYYTNARKRHENAAQRTLALSSVGAFLGTIATGLSGILGTIDPAFAGIASAGVIGVAISTFALTQEGISPDRRNAERYERTCEALEELRKKLDDVREAAAQNNREPLEKFVLAVHEHLSLDHRQWLKTVESTQQSIASLQDSLDNHKKSMEESEN